MAKDFRRTDFTQGSIPKHLVLFTLPMLVGNLLQALYNTIDTIWVGRFLGPQALAGVAVSFPLIFALIALILGLTMATTTLVAQYYGAGQIDKVKKTIANSFLLLSILGVIISIIGIVWRRALLRLINVPDDVIEYAASYLGVFMAGLLPMFLYNVAGAILRGLGDSRTPLRFLVYATVLNIVLDPLLIFGFGPIPGLGVAGAALATVISQGFSAVIALRYLGVKSGLMSFSREALAIDLELTRLTLKIGLPAGVQQVFVSLSGLAVSFIVNRFGSVVMAGFGIGQKIDQFAFLPAMSMGIAVSALVGQNLGAGKEERVREIVKWSSILGGGVTSLVSLGAIFFPQAIVALFSSDAVVVQLGASYLRIIAVSYIPFALMFTLSGVLRGAGDTIPAMLITLFSLWAVRIPLAAYLSTWPTLGAQGVFVAIASSPIVGMIIYYFYYRSGRWKRFAVTRATE